MSSKAAKRNLAVVYNSDEDLDYVPSDSKRKIPNRKKTNGQVKKCYFDTLPDELILHIFKQLHGNTDSISFFNSCNTVCWRWRNVMLTPSLWTRVNVVKQANLDGDKRPAESSGLLRIVQNAREIGDNHFLRNMSSLRLNALRYKIGEIHNLQRFHGLQQLSICDMPMNMVHLNKVLPSLKLLTRIHLEYHNQTMMYRQVDIADLFTALGLKIRDIKLQGFAVARLKYFLNAILVFCCEVEHLEISQHKPGAMYDTMKYNLTRLNELSHLKSLDLSGYSIIYNEDIYNKVKLPNLERFTYGFYVKGVDLVNIAIFNMFNYTPKLRELTAIGMNLASVEHSVTSFQLTFLRLKPKLVSLNLYGCKLDYRIVDSIAMLRDSLKHLSLDSCDVYGTNDIDHIVGEMVNLPHLTDLNLKCQLITDDNLRFILKSRPLLNTLDLTGCRHLSRGLKKYYESYQQIKKLQESLK